MKRKKQPESEVLEIESTRPKPRSHSGRLVLECNLNGKEKRFCEEYVYDWNGSRAYIVAFPNKKLQVDSATSQASTLIRNLNIQKYIDLLQKNVARIAGISQLKVVEEYMKIAFSSIADLHNTWIERKEFEELPEDQKSCIAEISTETRKKIVGYQGEDDTTTPIYMVTEFVKIKLYDKLKALEGLRKMLGYDAPDKLDIKSNITHRQVSDIPLDELSEQAKKLLFEIGVKQLTDGQRDN